MGQRIRRLAPSVGRVSLSAVVGIAILLVWDRLPEFLHLRVGMAEDVVFSPGGLSFAFSAVGACFACAAVSTALRLARPVAVLLAVTTVWVYLKLAGFGAYPAGCPWGQFDYSVRQSVGEGAARIALYALISVVSAGFGAVFGHALKMPSGRALLAVAGSIAVMMLVQAAIYWPVVHSSVADTNWRTGQMVDLRKRLGEARVRLREAGLDPDARWAPRPLPPRELPEGSRRTPASDAGSAGP